jgi:hypothetical protein
MNPDPKHWLRYIKPDRTRSICGGNTGTRNKCARNLLDIKQKFAEKWHDENMPKSYIAVGL